MEFLDSVIYVVFGGSNLYGLYTEDSDVNLRGIFIPLRKERNSLFYNEDGIKNNPEFNNNWKFLKNFENTKFESILFPLSKFFRMLIEQLPSSIEILFSEKENILFFDETFYRVLKKNKKLFCSKRLYSTFLNYAMYNFSKMELHRKWIQKVPEEPKRESFHLPSINESGFFSVNESIIKKNVEDWNFSYIKMDNEFKISLKERIIELINLLSSSKKFSFQEFDFMIQNLNIFSAEKSLKISDEMLNLFLRDSSYRNEYENWKQYEIWKSSLKDDQIQLYNKVGYDTKYGMNFLRILYTLRDISVNNTILINRKNNREELLSVKNGNVSYSSLLRIKERLESEINDSYRNISFPENLNLEKIDNLYKSLLEVYDNKG